MSNFNFEKDKKMNNSAKNSETVKMVVGIGVFSALAYVVVGLCQLIPNVAGFLSIDAKDAVIAIASFIYGPIVAPIISLFVAFLEMITFGAATGFWGFLMNFISSAVFSTTASLIYKFRKSLNFAIIGFCAATVLTTVVMIGMNPLIVPLYSGATREVVISMINPILLPFNFAKTMLNSAVAMLLYKPIINAMRRAGLIAGGKYKTTFNKTTVISLVVGGLFLLTSMGMLIAMLLIF